MYRCLQLVASVADSELRASSRLVANDSRQPSRLRTHAHAPTLISKMSPEMLQRNRRKKSASLALHAMWVLISDQPTPTLQTFSTTCTDDFPRQRIPRFSLPGDGFHLSCTCWSKQPPQHGVRMINQPPINQTCMRAKLQPTQKTTSGCHGNPSFHAKLSNPAAPCCRTPCFRSDFSVRARLVACFAFRIIRLWACKVCVHGSVPNAEPEYQNGPGTGVDGDSDACPAIFVHVFPFFCPTFHLLIFPFTAIFTHRCLTLVFSFSRLSFHGFFLESFPYVPLHLQQT